MITYQRIQSSNFMPLRKLSKKSVFWTPSRDVFVIVPCSLISTWPVGEVLQLSPARKHYFVNSRISLSSVSALLCRVWLLGAFSKRRFETARSLRVQEDLDRHSYKMSIISKCVFFGGDVVFICFSRSSWTKINFGEDSLVNRISPWIPIRGLCWWTVAGRSQDFVQCSPSWWWCNHRGGPRCVLAPNQPSPLCGLIKLAANWGAVTTGCCR